MSGPVSADEVRRWYNSRGIDVPRRNLPDRFVDGWNKAHPDRPYVRNALIHGSWRAYNEFSCRCEECAAAAARVMNTAYHQRKHPAT